MSCNCQNIVPLSPSGECLPSITDECAFTRAESICREVDPSCVNSTDSEGTTLANSWTDAACYNSGATILARVGSKLARFSGTGFISLVNGVASVVTSVPLRVSTIWHRWWKATPTSAPILGEPLAYPYQVIADSNGTLHGIRGPEDEKAVGVWNPATKDFTQTPLSEVPKQVKGVVRTSTGIELTGFAPIAGGGDVAAVRDMKALSGSGLVILTEQVTVDDSCECAPGSGTASVAATLELPTPVADETYTLKFSTALGLYWSEDA